MCTVNVAESEAADSSFAVLFNLVVYLENLQESSLSVERDVQYKIRCYGSGCEHWSEASKVPAAENESD